MYLTILISTIFYAGLLWVGRMMQFIDPIIYYSIPAYVLLLLLTMKLYDENCKAMEVKDFLITALFVGGLSFAYWMMQHQMNVDIIAFLYLACFLPYVAYASSIRYKSLM